MGFFSKIKRRTWGWLFGGAIMATLIGYGLKYVFEEYNKSKKTD